MNLHFTHEFSRYSEVIYSVHHSQNFNKTKTGTQDKFEIKMSKISRRGSRSPYNETFGLVLQRTATKCTKHYNARAQSLYCSLILMFSDVLIAVASWFRKLSSDYGDPEDNAQCKKIHFTFEFRNCLDLFCAPFGLRTCSS